ncbi:MAG: hypothetical protein K6A36_05150 [Paludibacteraceae bacterium]|nr:hypothetical protein [Paludibacteraceae bacterium]
MTQILHINHVNWPQDFPEKPEVRVEVNNDHENLYLHYFVKGEQLRAATIKDQGPVWEDSCVEFFCQTPDDDHYMNFETNCIGAMVASRRKGRATEVEPLTAEEMTQIKRRCTYPREIIEEKDGIFEWEVELQIPLSLIFRNQEMQFPQTLRANFYKCADKTKKPHFLSWQPVDLPKPDFHCPQFFGELTLE